MVEPDEIKGSFDSGDPNTTNLYLGNLNPKVMCIYYYFNIFYVYIKLIKITYYLM